MRLQKFLSQQGICSRRQAEKLIADGQIKINGKIAIIGINIDPKKDKVSINNINVSQNNSIEKKYIILNKPAGYICSTTNQQGDSVLDLISKKDKQKYLYPVGRLDKDSTGLILITNDGELTNLLTHPRYEHTKEYDVQITKSLEKKDIEKLEKGMVIYGQKYNGMQIRKIEQLTNNNCVITIVLKEGKNRQIRKMFGNLGYRITALKRTRINKLRMKNLKPGQYRFVKKEDII